MHIHSVFFLSSLDDDFVILFECLKIWKKLITHFSHSVTRWVSVKWNRSGTIMQCFTYCFSKFRWIESPVVSLKLQNQNGYNIYKRRYFDMLPYNIASCYTTSVFLIIKFSLSSPIWFSNNRIKNYSLNNL